MLKFFTFMRKEYPPIISCDLFVGQRIPDALLVCNIKIFTYILAVIYRLFEGCIYVQTIFIIIFMLILMTCVCGIIQLTVSIADFHCILFLAAATLFNLITELIHYLVALETASCVLNYIELLNYTLILFSFISFFFVIYL